MGQPTPKRSSRLLSLKKQLEDLGISVTRGATSGSSRKATDMMADMPIPQETAIPTPIKTNAGSLTPLDLINTSEVKYGSRERAALATVFGVHEYTEPKIFWESGCLANAEDSGRDEEVDMAAAPPPPTANAIPSQYASPAVVKPRQLGAAASKSFVSLPEIPTVSAFDDLFLLEVGSTLWHAHRLQPQPNVAPTRPLSTLSEGGLLATSLAVQHSQDTEKDCGELVVAPPLLFIDAPPAIFDLLASDDDARIIAWGPDPSVTSAAMATTSSVPAMTSRSVKGFSSNTTSAAKPVPSPSHRSPTSTVRWSAQHFSETARTLKSKGSASLSNLSIKKNGTNRTTQRRTFPPSMKKSEAFPSEDAALPRTIDVPQVIEAASVEKLVEKLTNSLDYTFMTDFFLIYRAFISPMQLCKLLILRFQWALEKDDGIRQVVRLRAFVVLRHWLLNYFLHDFIPCRDLRILLTSFLNTLPSHPTVQHSIRDQRIVKGLKRVVRRLKRVYYYDASNERVRVIQPPPPTYDQERAEELARSKLSLSTLRRKAALGFDVGSRHHGNVAVQDHAVAPVIVVGSLHSQPSNIPLANSRAKRMKRTTSIAVSLRSIGSIRRVHLGRQKKSKKKMRAEYLRQEAQLQSEQQTDVPSQQTTLNPSTSTLSDASLESDLSPGTTVIDASDDVDTKDAGTPGYAGDDSQSWKSSEQWSTRLKLERKQREEEEERMRAAFFSGVDEETHVNDDEDEDEDEDDHPVEPHSAVSYKTEGNMSALHSKSSSPTNTRPSSPRIAALTALENAPRRKALIGDLSSPWIQRTHSSLWCRRTSDEDMSGQYQYPLRANVQEETCPEEVLDEFRCSPGLRRSMSMEGLTLALAKKNTARHQRFMRESAPTSLAASPRLGPSPNNTSALPDLTLLSESLEEAKLELGNPPADGPENTEHDLQGAKRRPSVSFCAVPYDETSCAAPIKLSALPSKKKHAIKAKKSLTQKLSRAFAKKTPASDRRPPMPTNEPLQLSSRDAPTEEATTPEKSPPASTVIENLPLEQSTGSRFVSRIAEELRGDRDLECLCIQCTGDLEATHRCRRFSGMLIVDEERRKSAELRRRRGASVHLERVGHSTSDNQSSRYEPFSFMGTPMHRRLRSEDGSSSGMSSQRRRTGSTSDKKSVVTHESHGTEQDTRVSGLAQQNRHSLPSEKSLPVPRVSRLVELDIVPYSITSPPLTPITDKTMDSHRFLFAFRTDVLAQHFCFIERDVLLDIDWEEMIHCRWTRMGTEPSALEDQASTFANKGGIEKVIERFNTVCQWVASEIVETERLSERVKVVEKLIRLAQKCFLYSNFATLVQILLGLQSPSVTRLQKTWDRVHAREQKILRQLSHFTSPTRNWKHIRDSMTLVAEEHGMSPAQVQIEMPGTNLYAAKKTKIKYPFGGCIPFLGIYLSDLVFNSEQPAYIWPRTHRPTPPTLSPVLQQPLVNFRKHRITTTVIKRVLIFQGLARRYSFDQDDTLYAFCRDLRPLDTETIRILSLKMNG